MRWQKPLAAAVVLTALTTTLTASAMPGAAPGGPCSPDARFLGFSDALNKTSYDGQLVSGLSALNVTGPHSAVALVDNVLTSPARVFTLKVSGKPTVSVDGMTILKRPDGTPFNAQDFDGEGLVVERGNRTILATSEREPSIRRFRLSDGLQIGSLPVPARFQVAPAGEAVSNGTFESLVASRDGRSVFAGMEEPLAPDGRDTDDRGRNRILHYTGRSGHDYRVAAQYAYKTDPGLSLVELAWVSPTQLVSMERTFVAGVGNTIRVFTVSLRHASDVSKRASLADAPEQVYVKKKLLFDLVNCPPSGATALQPQPNPLLDNVEALALGGYLPGGRRQLYLLSDDNNGKLQITRFYSLAVDLH
ncbi:esterase-like activity of phytase family protein [Kribbella antibiotica]|uniref:Esterase-like activity of phytase family protein n=1 Tax=Kribbella antibiotica TaxID=190195 RepID=A0A4R4ZSL2_9ACTN|nr:esterase-like activity of phytase family protein [Kribbella antibiotica]TDD61370.1 esterase-like activity of phytase family protein [Kribbella antibiotica]